MSSRSLNRKEFLIVTVSAVTASVLAAACGTSDPAPTNTGTAGTGTGGSGTSGTGTGGSGTAGSGTGGTGTAGTGTAGTGTGGSSTGGSSSGSNAGGASGGGMGGASGGTGGASGGAGGASGGSGGGASCSADIMVTSSKAADNHTHTLAIPMADITAGADKAYQTGPGGGGNHMHWVKLTAADFTTLKSGGEVKKRNCGQGPHEYVLKCGGGGSAPVAPTDCTGTCGSAMDMTCP